MDSPETIANRILARAGLRPSDAAQARRRLDGRLSEYGLQTLGNPTPIRPGASLLGTPTADVTGLLISGNEKKIHQQDVDLYGPDATFGPDDFSAAVAVTSLQTTALGGTEVKFSDPGIVYVGAGPCGVYYANALGAGNNTKWMPVMSGVRIPYSPKAGLFFGSNTAGAVTIGGVIAVAFYKIQKEHLHKRGAWKSLHRQITDWTEGSSDATGTAGVAMSFSAAMNGTDVTLGTFSDAGVGTQIFLAGSNMPVGGASKKGAAILNASSANTDIIWVAETAALRVASNGGLGPLGQDQWNIPVGGKLFCLANSGTQVLGARYRS